MIDAYITGEQQLNERLSKLSQAEFFDALLADMAQQLFDQAEQGVAKHSKTGLLERSLGGGAEKISERTYEIKSDGAIAPYNVFLHWGYREHIITPTKRKALRWVGGNGFIFSKWAKIPAYAGDPFMVTATNNVLREFDAIAQTHMRDL